MAGAPEIGHTRNALAYLVLLLSGAGIVTISWVALATAPVADRADVAQLVFTAVLPLLGTWVGAVLAYYFSKDNLQAGSQATLDALRATVGPDSNTQVTSVMIPSNRIRPREDVASDTEAQTLVLVELYNKMTGSGMSRVPIFSTRKVLYVVHEPDIDKFAQAKGVASDSLPQADTLAALLAVPALKTAVTAIAAVPGTATIAEARASLASVNEAKDVFVTDDGSTTGKVLGWLTNSDLARVT